MKLIYPKDWFKRSASIEGDVEIGVGVLPDSQLNEPRTLPPPKIETGLAFGQFVLLWRRNKGWNAEQLAVNAGVGIEEILEIEHDPYCQPEPDAVYKLAGIFGVPPSKLMEIAGLIQARSPHLREEAVRFAARSEPIAALSESEKQAFESFVAALISETPNQP